MADIAATAPNMYDDPGMLARRKRRYAADRPHTR
jgi:hypothetical protein